MKKKTLTKNIGKNKNYKRTSNIFDVGGSFGAITSGLSGMAEAAVANSQVSTAEADNAIEAVNNYKPETSSLEALADSYNNISFAASDYNHRDLMVDNMTGIVNMGKAALSGAYAGTSVGGGWGGLVGGIAGALGAGAGWLMGKQRALTAEKKLERDALLANRDAAVRAMDARDDLMINDYNNIMRNVVAKGGRIFTKPNNKFKNGGAMHQHGGIFSNGVISIDNGGTHEENPLEGVQIGVDYEGIPNLVEEGEVIWNDYVFSNRLKVPGKKHTFAVEAEKLQEESEERPNDPISKRGLEDSMLKLIQEQENVRQKDNVNSSNKFDKGGMKNKKSKSTRNVFNSLTQQLFDRYKYIDRLGYHTVEEGKELEAQERLKRELGVPSTTPPPSNFIEGLIDKAIREDVEYKTGPKRKFDSGSWLRYMPAIGSGLSVLSDAFGLTNKSDYSNIEGIKEATNAIKQVGYKPVDTKMTYNPFDTQFYGAKLAEQNAATKQAIQNTAQTSGQAVAGLLAADYNNVGKLGDLYRQAEEYNQAQREKVLGFNRQTDAMNSEMAMKAAIANQANDKLRLSSAITQAQMRDQIDAQANAGKSANLSNLFTNLGNIGTDIFNRQQSDMLLGSGVYGTLSMKPAWWSDKQWAEYQAGLAAQRATPTTPTPPANQGTPVGLGPSTGTIDEDDAWWRYRDEDLEYAKGGKIKRRRKIKKGLTY